MSSVPEKQSQNAVAWYFEKYQVRTFLDAKGDPWWVLGDVCVPLGFSGANDVAARLKDDEKLYFDPRTGQACQTRLIGDNTKVTCINEKGLYRIIFRSEKPEAQRFQDWVFGEVLPQIRKTGKYDPKGPRAKKISKYVRKGKPVEWAEERVDGIDDRRTFTRVLNDAGVTGYGVATCTDTMYKPIVGDRARDARAKRGLPARSNLREGMTTDELRTVALAEITASRAIPETDTRGTKDCINACRISAEEAITAVSNAHLGAVRRILERRTGLS